MALDSAMTNVLPKICDSERESLSKAVDLASTTTPIAFD